MITLTRKLKKDATSGGQANESRRISVRDRLLVKEVQEMEQNLPSTCNAYFSDPNVLSEFTLTITPDEGFWKDGKFKFNISVPEEYNMTVCFFGVNIFDAVYICLMSVLSYKLTATKSKMHNKTVASKHIGNGRYLSFIITAELYRWLRLGTNTNVKGRYLGT